jgi:arginase
MVDILSEIYSWGEKTVSEGAFPLFIGGDHSIALGTIGGVSASRRTGVIWVDAHGDFNTHETSPSGNIHGMPLAALCGYGRTELVDLGRKGAKINPKDVVLVGIRDLDPGEQELLRESGATVYTMREIDEVGIAEIMRRALAKLKHLEHIHLSLDMDSLDPTHAPGVGTPVSGGLTSRETHLIMEMLADHGKISSMDIVEVNPILDDRNRTAELAVELAASVFGKSII